MPTTHTLVIGAGQAGLAVSRSLADADVDHVVLERGRVAERWRSHRWEALRLLTPNWATRLPGWSYQGPHPDGYMTATELAGYLTDYAALLRRAGPRAQPGPLTGAGRGRLRRADRRRPLAGRQRRDRHRVVRRTPRAGRGRSARPGHRAGHHLVVPQPRRAPRRPRPGRRRLRHRRAARRRAGPRRSRRRAGRRPPQPPPAVLPGRRHLVVARPDRHLRPDHRPGLRPGTVPAARAPCSWPAGPTTATSTCPPSNGWACAWPGGWSASTAPASASRTTCRSRRPPPTRGSSGSSTRSTATSVPSGSAPTCCPRHRGVRSTSPSGSTSWTSATSRSAPSSGPPGSPGPTRGCTSPCSTSGARSPTAAASRPHAGLYVLGQRFQHRGDSNFIDGVRHDAAHVARHIASRLQSHEPIAS